MKLRVKFNKKNYLKYLSHLDLMRLFQRSFKRAEIPLEYSKGFNPQPKFSIASALSLGVESEEEYMDIELSEEIGKDYFMDKMNSVLPEDIKVLDCYYPKEKTAIASMIEWGLYSLELPKDLDISFLEGEEILISRFRKKGKKKVLVEENIVDLIGEYRLINKDDFNILEIYLRTGENANIRISDFSDALIRESGLDINMGQLNIRRIGLFILDGDKMIKPM